MQKYSVTSPITWTENSGRRICGLLKPAKGRQLGDGLALRSPNGRREGVSDRICFRQQGQPGNGLWFRLQEEWLGSPGFLAACRTICPGSKSDGFRLFRGPGKLGGLLRGGG